jgi:hypothetical protein
MARLHVLKVFIGENGASGNPQGVSLAEPRPDGSVEIGGRTEPVEVREHKGGS